MSERDVLVGLRADVAESIATTLEPFRPGRFAKHQVVRVVGHGLIGEDLHPYGQVFHAQDGFSVVVAFHKKGATKNDRPRLVTIPVEHLEHGRFDDLLQR